MSCPPEEGDVAGNTKHNQKRRPKERTVKPKHNLVQTHEAEKKNKDKIKKRKWGGKAKNRQAKHTDGEGVWAALLYLLRSRSISPFAVRSRVYRLRRCSFTSFSRGSPIISVLRNMIKLSELSWLLPPPAATELQIIDAFLAHNYRRFWFLGFRVDDWKRQR